VIDKVDVKKLIEAAWVVRMSAYAPYSKFKVGAALLAESGMIYAACNVENRSLGLTLCAERAGVGSAIAAGETGFIAIALAAKSDEPIVPCGACRQTLAEFSPDMRVVCSTAEDGPVTEFNLADLLPRPSQGILA
jgi:cytidine deaminase